MKQKIMSRKEYTRYMLKEGLLQSLTQESFEQVTVASLCRVAGVTRSTFYLHYTNVMDVVDELLVDAIDEAGNGVPSTDNFKIITDALGRANTLEELERAYDSVYTRLPLCQRVSGERKYHVLFNDPILSEYIINYIYHAERDVQGPLIAKQVGVPEVIGDSLFYFCLHGLYAINQKYNFQRTPEWFVAQRALFQFILTGMKGVKSLTTSANLL